MAVSPRQTSREALIAVAEELLGRRDELAEEITDAVLARVPYYAALGPEGAVAVREWRGQLGARGLGAPPRRNAR